MIAFTESLLRGTYEISKSARTTGYSEFNFNFKTVTNQLADDDLQSSVLRGTLDSKTFGLSRDEYERDLQGLQQDCRQTPFDLEETEVIKSRESKPLLGKSSEYP